MCKCNKAISGADAERGYDLQCRCKQASTNLGFSYARHERVEGHFAKLRPQHLLVAKLGPRGVDFFKRRVGVVQFRIELIGRFETSAEQFG